MPHDTSNQSFEKVDLGGGYFIRSKGSGPWRGPLVPESALASVHLAVLRLDEPGPIDHRGQRFELVPLDDSDCIRVTRILADGRDRFEPAVRIERVDASGRSKPGPEIPDSVRGRVQIAAITLMSGG